MLSKYIRKESIRVIEKVMNFGLSKIWSINARKMSSWEDWRDLAKNVKEIKGKSDIVGESLKTEISSATNKLENIIQSTSENIVANIQTANQKTSSSKPSEQKQAGNKENQDFSSKMYEFLYKGIYDGSQGIVKLFAAIFLGGSLAYLVKKHMPEKIDNILEKYIPGYQAKEKLYIKPEAFDTKNMITRTGTQRLEDFINTKFFSAEKKNIFALVGPAGSGKSEMALEYAHNMWHQFEKKSSTQTRIIQIIHAENPDILEEEYITFAKKLNINIDNKDITNIQNEVNEILALYSNWILIFDNVNEYNSIGHYIPKSTNGKVLLTKQTTDGLFVHNIEIIDVTSINYRLSDKEALKIFEIKIPTLTLEQKNQVPTLAYKLLYSPLALKRVSDLIVNGHTFDNVVKKLDQFQKAQTKLTYNEKYKNNLLQLNQELIHPLSGDTKALLAVILYSNPDYTHTILDMNIDLKSIADTLSFDIADMRKEIEIMSELKSKDIVSGYRGDRTHRSMREAFAGVISKSEVDILKAIAPIYMKLKMSNYFKSDSLNNSPIIPHIQSFFELVQKEGSSDIKLCLDVIYMLRNLGTQFVSSDHRKAKKYLDQAKVAFEEIIKEKGSQNPAHTIDPKDFKDPQNLFNKLTEHNKILGDKDINLIDLYAGILYQLGRIYFHTKDQKSKDDSNKYLECAQFLASGARSFDYKIGESNSVYDENKGFVFKQSGLLFMKLDKEIKADKDISNDTDDVITEYIALLKDPELQKDSRSMATCHKQLVSAYLQLYEIEKKTIQIDNAYEHLNLIISIANNGIRPQEFLVLKGKVFLFKNDFEIAVQAFDEAITLLEKESNFNNPFLVEAYLGKAKAIVGSVEPIKLFEALNNPQVVYNIEPYIDASIRIQKSLGRSMQHPEMKEAQDWKLFIDNLRMAEQLAPTSEFNIRVMCVTEIKYNNPVINLNVLNSIAKKEGITAVNSLIAIEKNHQKFLQNLETNDKEVTAHNVLIDKGNYGKPFSEQTSSFYTVNRATIISYVVKEGIEAVPTIKYFLNEILHLPITFPEILENNYFRLITHYSACNMGMFSIASEIDIVKPILSTTIYGTRIFAFDMLSTQKQKNLEIEKDKSINTPYEFIEKCGFDMVAQGILGSLGDIVLGTSSVYGLTISATVGGMQCYNLYKAYNKDINAKNFSVIQTVVPYIIDVITFCTVTKNLNYNFNTPIEHIMYVKQSFVMLSSVVTADYVIKLSLYSIQDTIHKIEEDYIDPLLHYVGECINYIQGI